MSSKNTDTADPPTRVVRELWWPVLAPSFVYSAGAAAIVPAQVLTGLQLGMSPSQVSVLVTWLGLCAVIGSVVAGYCVQMLGERSALGIATAVGSAALAVLLAWLGLDGPAKVWAFCVALSVVEVVDGVWSLARQNLVAERIPDESRAKAMNTYGGSQRIGRVVGPLLTSAVIVVGNVEFVYVAHIVLAVVAYAMVRRATEPRVTAATTTTGRPATSASWPPGLARAFAMIGIGVVSLAVLRTDRDLLIPLWGSQQLRLDGSQIALVLGLCAALELLLFYPAGIVMDRIGRTPVVLGCLMPMALGFAAMWIAPNVAGYLTGADLLGIGNGVGAGIIKTLGTDLAPAATRAHFLGWWNAVANAGALLAPALTSAVLLVGSLHTVMLAAAALGFLGAAWMAWWLPRLLPEFT